MSKTQGMQLFDKQAIESINITTQAALTLSLSLTYP